MNKIKISYIIVIYKSFSNIQFKNNFGYELTIFGGANKNNISKAYQTHSPTTRHRLTAAHLHELPAAYKQASGSSIAATRGSNYSDSEMSSHHSYSTRSTSISSSLASTSSSSSSSNPNQHGFGFANSGANFSGLSASQLSRYHGHNRYAGSVASSTDVSSANSLLDNAELNRQPQPNYHPYRR